METLGNRIFMACEQAASNFTQKEPEVVILAAYCLRIAGVFIFTAGKRVAGFIVCDSTSPAVVLTEHTAACK